jgi:PhnB protein
VTRPDPLAALLRPSSPAGPRAVFTAALRERLEAELEPANEKEGEPMPDTTHSTTRVTQVMPHLVVNGAAGAIDFYRAAFGAEEVGERYLAPDGSVAHAEIALGESIVSLSDESAHEQGPETIGGTPVRVSLYVDDVDRFAERAVAAGATVVYPVADQPYGLRGGRLRDPFGHLWIVHSPPAR